MNKYYLKSKKYGKNMNFKRKKDQIIILKVK